MKLVKGYAGGWYLRFDNPHGMERWDWLFLKILRRRLVCCGGYDNAYHLFG